MVIMYETIYIHSDNDDKNLHVLYMQVIIKGIVKLIVRIRS